MIHREPTDPYQTPAPAPPSEPDLSGIPIPDSVVSHLASARPWTRACAIVGFLLGLTFLMATATLALSFFAQVPLRRPSITGGLFLGDILLGLSVALLTILSAIRLWQFGSSIDPLCESMDCADLEVTVYRQHRFWRSAGLTAFASLIAAILLFLTIFTP